MQCEEQWRCHPRWTYLLCRQTGVGRRSVLDQSHTSEPLPKPRAHSPLAGRAGGRLKGAWPTFTGLHTSPVIFWCRSGRSDGHSIRDKPQARTHTHTQTVSYEYSHTKADSHTHARTHTPSVLQSAGEHLISRKTGKKDKACLIRNN